MSPAFSIVVATYNRGRHIRPTLESALRQSFRDFELIVVADGCTDDTLDVVRALGSPHVRVFELPSNSGSQSTPNNLGVARARGRFIAYLGHDDIWCPDHLARLAEGFARHPPADVVASGCVFHGPPGTDIAFVTGMLDAEHTATEHFLPPSALAHARSLIERIGPWPDPESVPAPVDCELMLRAVRAGAVFAATGNVTVHKFAAGHRYLSYLNPASSEQAAALELMSSPNYTADAYVTAARAQGRYMVMKYLDYEAFGKGHLYQRNRWNKGLERPPLRRLEGKVLLRQTDEPRGLDWHELEKSSQPYRWSGPSPAPKILIPLTGDGAARVTLNVLPAAAEVLDGLAFEHDGKTIAHVVDTSSSQVTKLEVELRLRADGYSILGIRTPHMFCPGDDTGTDDRRRLGIPVGDLEIAPL